MAGSNTLPVPGSQAQPLRDLTQQPVEVSFERKPATGWYPHAQGGGGNGAGPPPPPPGGMGTGGCMAGPGTAGGNGTAGGAPGSGTAAAVRSIEASSLASGNGGDGGRYCGGCSRYRGEGSVWPVPGCQVWQPAIVARVSPRPARTRPGQRSFVMTVFVPQPDWSDDPPSHGM